MFDHAHLCLLVKQKKTCECFFLSNYISLNNIFSLNLARPMRQTKHVPETSKHLWKGRIIWKWFATLLREYRLGINDVTKMFICRNLVCIFSSVEEVGWSVPVYVGESFLGVGAVRWMIFMVISYTRADDETFVLNWASGTNTFVIAKTYDEHPWTLISCTHG